MTNNNTRFSALPALRLTAARSSCVSFRPGQQSSHRPFSRPHEALGATINAAAGRPKKTCCHVNEVFMTPPVQQASTQEANHRDIRRAVGTAAHPAKRNLPLCFSLIPGSIRLPPLSSIRRLITAMTRYNLMLLRADQAPDATPYTWAGRQDTHTQRILTLSAAKMHDGTDDDASSGIQPGMRRSPCLTLLAFSPSP
ncbi:hypothetical protein DHEL01_v204701 [Diaporthe helianthi]|uniref:Uncharacterized protein n=1 Tax=Diaporthe helianthi TaxID=158607 RepID=A0A2P5I312_DIAHE|nr:hypothetical protein DHEL01_v204701 [Diaporthe helianthi]